MSNSFGNKLYYINGDPNQRVFIVAVDLNNGIAYSAGFRAYRRSRLLPYALK